MNVTELSPNNFFATKVLWAQSRGEQLRELVGEEGTVYFHERDERVYCYPHVVTKLTEAGFEVEVSEQWNDPCDGEVCNVKVVSYGVFQ